MTDAERQKRYRDRLRGGPAPVRELAPHGELGAVRRHQRAGEDLCELCVVEWRRYRAEMYRRNKDA